MHKLYEYCDFFVGTDVLMISRKRKLTINLDYLIMSSYQPYNHKRPYAKYCKLIYNSNRED